MGSVTDRIIREAHAAIARKHGDAGAGEILDHLAWEVGGAAAELVSPAPWVRRALVRTGICEGPAEAQARIARLVAWQALAPTGARGDPEGRWAVEPPADAARDAAVRRLEADIANDTIIIHARLESCPPAELDQAAETMINLALEHGDAGIVEDVVVSLLIFSGDWGEGRWWDRDPDGEGGPAPGRSPSMHDA